MKTQYVVGLAFNAAGDYVALIKKNKPRWQAGLLNGIGGKVELSDGPHVFAMQREFMEETGVITSAADWRHMGKMVGPLFVVDMFVARDDRICHEARTTTEETVIVIPVVDLKRYDCVSNLEWMVWAALDRNEGRPPFFRVEYDDPRP